MTGSDLIGAEDPMIGWNWDELEGYESRVNLVLVLDHGGRAGSNFFQCLFDNHPSFVVSPLIHYVYSYWIRVFGDKNVVDTKDAHRFVSVSSYSRLLYQEPFGDIGKLIYKIGGDPEAPFDRAKFRSLIDTVFARKETVTRREVILWTYAAYAIVRGFSLNDIKLIGINDAVSLASENMLDGFSACITDHAADDFPELINLALVRDPRAQFASTRHQMVNEFGNNYMISFGNWWNSFSKLWKNNISLEHGPAHFCSVYQYAAFIALMRKWKENRGHWYFIRNEDINTNFVPTILSLCDLLGIQPDSAWLSGENYTVTMLGRPWAGTGAYSSRYQEVVNGPIQNDSDAISAKAVGPNRYVTERWKSRIPAREKLLLDCLFYEEISAFGYSFSFALIKQPKKLPTSSIWAPYPGEVPEITWLLTPTKILERFFYLISFMPFYCLARVRMKKLYEQDGFFSQFDFMNIFLKKSVFVLRGSSCE
ncbi:hypothetical protein [Owenweeksia hongkongensis]|uniref:hypothetical protein n=1 Tax=Owenweeksia hongkongensis TaxID=253245 RepID=UPI003A92BA24